MTPTNKIRLLMVIEKDKPLRSAVDTDTTLDYASKHMFNTIESTHEVWFSPTGFGGRDDAKSVGFIRIPACLVFNERSNRKYKLSVISTSITEQFKNNWGLVLKLPQATIEHQTAINAGLMFKTE